MCEEFISASAGRRPGESPRAVGGEERFSPTSQHFNPLAPNPSFMRAGPLWPVGASCRIYIFSLYYSARCLFFEIEN